MPEAPTIPHLYPAARRPQPQTLELELPPFVRVELVTLRQPVDEGRPDGDDPSITFDVCDAGAGPFVRIDADGWATQGGGEIAALCASLIRAHGHAGGGAPASATLPRRRLTRPARRRGGRNTHSVAP